jgi:hypothetical protein
MDAISQIRTDLAVALPAALVDALIDSYVEIKRNYMLDRHEPAELNGGKFVEACYRIVQAVSGGGSFTPVGVSINDMIGKLRAIEQLPVAAANEAYRIHIPRALLTIYNVRNKRGVGHLGGDVNPNHADATLLAGIADWVVAELFRIHYECTLTEAQGIVDSIVQRDLPLVAEVGDLRRVLLGSLSLKQQTLVLLFNCATGRKTVADLIRDVEPKDPAAYVRRVIRPLHQERMVDASEPDSLVLLPPGAKYVEQHIPSWTAQLNKGG